MYRVAVRGSKELTSKTTVLSRRCLSKASSAAPREAGFGKLLVVLSPVLVTGGVVTYAKYDDGFRKTLVQSVPAIEPALNYLLKEDLAKELGGAKDTVMGLFGGNSNDTPAKKVDDVPPPLAKKKFDVPVPAPTPAPAPKPAVASVPVPMPEAPPSATTATPAKKDVPVKVEKAPEVKKAVPAPTKTEVKPAATVAAAIPVPTPTPTPAPASLDLSNLDGEIQVALKGALGDYQKAIRVLTSYNSEVKQIVDGSIEKVEDIPWNQLKNRTRARNAAVQAAEASAQSAADALARIAKEAGSSETVKEHLEEAQNKLNAAKTDLFKAKELSNMSERYWRKVEDARGFFVSEMEALFPDVNVTDKKMKLSKEELDLFTLYAYSHVLAYQKELHKLQVDGEARLTRALDQLKSEDLPRIEDQLQYYLEKEKREMTVHNQKKLLQMRHEGEQRIRDTLRKQAEAHVDHLNEALKLKETEMRRLFEREMDDRVMKEKTSYKTQLAAYLGKLRGMEDALKARSDADKSAQQSQALWAACQSLWSGVKNGVPGNTWRQSLRPLKNEIKAVGKASEGDEFVKTVLDAVPPVALERGVFPEEALRERFVKVDQLARRLALVKDDGAKMPMYVLSYLQSMFILTPANAISKEELKDEIVDFEKLDTYDIMNRARYWMERGNLTQTVKYMNLLKGAPRKMAQDWINEARLLLETQQIVNTLMAHAASSGLLYL